MDLLLRFYEHWVFGDTFDRLRVWLDLRLK